MISVVCVFNNHKVFNDLLLTSLNKQTVSYQLIALDNRQQQFKSAAQALNFGARQALGEYIMFVHQDVDLSHHDFLEQSERLLNTIPNLGVAGVAGVGSSIIFPKIISNIKHGIPPRKTLGPGLSKPTKVQTVDECLIFVPKLIFNETQFDEGICSDWHLYGTELCINLNCRSLGTYVLPSEIYHRSMPVEQKNFKDIIKNKGVLPQEYYDTLEGVLKKHKHSCGAIYTTCGIWHTSSQWFALDRFIRMINDIASHFITVFSKPPCSKQL